jgi:hypothetical protein
MEVKKLKAAKAHIIYKTSDNETVPGGSTISKVGEDMNFLVDWAHKLGLEGINHKKVTDYAADVGSVAHFFIECWFSGDQPDVSEFSRSAIDVASMVFEKFKKAWDKNQLTLVSSEVSLVSDSLRYGGTLDIVARDKDGQLVLGDIKSQPRIYGAVYRQLAGYENLWNERNTEKIERRVVFRFGKEDPDDEEVRWLGDMAPHFEVFQKQLALYYAFRAINKKPKNK